MVGERKSPRFRLRTREQRRALGKAVQIDSISPGFRGLAHVVVVEAEACGGADEASWRFKVEERAAVELGER